MNWAEFKDPVFHVCLAGAVVASWSLAQEVIGSSSFTFVTKFGEFSETFRKDSNNAHYTITVTTKSYTSHQ